MDWYLILCSFMGCGALLWPLTAKRNAITTGWLAAIAPAVLFAWLLTKVDPIANGDFPVWSHNWVPELGVSLDFRLDGLGLLLAILISGIGATVLIYGGTYLAKSEQIGPFFGFVQLFMLSMLGIVASDNLILMFVFWELTSISSYFLIGLSHSDPNSRKSALRALLVTGAGGLALLAGILLLGASGGSLSLSELQTRGEIVQSSSHYSLILLLIAFGAFTKSAQFPFHFWLPDAMAAPTPVSAYLHSATMVKAGVFLLAKLTPVLGGTALWHNLLMVVGGVTMFLGALLSLAQTDLKRILAYSTLSALGTLVLLLGIGTELAIKAALVFMVVHALYKAPLFMIAGIVDKATGTRNITVLGGLGKHLPLVAVAASLAAFSMSGIPPFVGFIGKELLYEAQTQSGNYAILITCLGFLANAINVTVALNVGMSPFARGRTENAINPKARQWSLLFGPLLLAGLGAWIGFFPSAIGDGLIGAAVRDVAGYRVDVHLQLWHGLNLLLVLSVLTVALGFVLYAFHDRVRALVYRVVTLYTEPASEMFDSCLNRFLLASDRVTRFFQHGNLRLYLAVVLLCLTSLLVTALVTTSWTATNSLAALEQDSPIKLVPVAISVLTVVAGVAAIRSRYAMLAILAMGGVGYGVALLFAVFGAPDLALTQVLVETLTLVLFALVIRHLPELNQVERSTPLRKFSDLVISLTAGCALTLSFLAVRSQPMPMVERVSAEMTSQSYPVAHGKNVVNVILVDFRAFDTMGEICVLAIAGLGVAGLLMGPNRRDYLAEKTIATPIFRTSVRWLAPLLLGMSLFLLLRGHNEPGGGFIGGLVAGAGVFLKRLAATPHRPLQNRIPLLMIALGLSVALVSTLPSIVFGKTFMQGVWGGSIWLPLVGNTKLGTPFLFDIGVYFVVIGVSTLILSRLMRSEPGHSRVSVGGMQ